MRAWAGTAGIVALVVAAAAIAWSGRGPGNALAQDGGYEDECVTCHMDVSPGIIAHWDGSLHARHDVTCLGCHEADPGESDGELELSFEACS